MVNYSNAERPDLDWSQVRETVKLLAVSVALVENGMKAGDKSVNTLTDSFSGMVGHLQSISGLIETMPDSEPKAVALMHCQATSDTIKNSIIAFQFYDRLQQCLEHVSSSLMGLSLLVDDSSRIYNPNEWLKFQSEIRSRYSMESEKIMFDAILSGKSIQEALDLAMEVPETQASGEDEIELF